MKNEQSFFVCSLLSSLLVHWCFAEQSARVISLPHGSCKSTFLKPGLRVETFENAVLTFSCGQQIHVLCVSMRPSPHPSTPRRLMTTTTTMADYMLQKILSLSGLLWQNILLLCHYAERKRIMDDRLAISIFFLLCSVSPIGLEFELKRVESFSMDPFGRKYSWNDAEEDGGKRSFWYV